MSHQPGCTRTHDVSDTPCGKQHVPGSPCDYCGKATPLDGSACPDCWTPIPENLADAKALLALGGLSVGTPKTYGMCTACGSVEVELDEVSGHRDLSAIGESPEYPTGYGCEVCS